ncbi:MAG: DUF1385 domain-containing protein, partial [Acidobacteria bacterium]|nr:DUF1385 domain-containing protein [Acidobacteriota bacterium]
RREVIRLSDRYPALKMPVLRGVVVLFQSLALGIRALNFSAEQVLEEDSRPEKKSSGSLGIFFSMLLALAFALGLFFYLPLLLTDGLTRLAPVLKGSLPFNLVEGTIRITLFIGYILAISALADMRRVFQYHGAEHKVVSTYEAGEPLTVEYARTHSTLHPRCGTSFLLFVMVISVLTFSLVPTSVSFGVKFASRLFLLPLIAGLSFELLRSSARNRSRLIYSAVVTPGMWLQRLTTREPNDDQLQVAIEALRVALGGKLPERREVVPL